MAALHRPPSSLRDLWLPDLFRITGLSSGRPDFTNMRVGVNARLFDDFDLAAVPLKTIDRKNLR
jgi:hypothetical protein